MATGAIGRKPRVSTAVPAMCSPFGGKLNAKVSEKSVRYVADGSLVSARDDDVRMLPEILR
jgi:hypothetical protein